METVGQQSNAVITGNLQMPSLVGFPTTSCTLPQGIIPSANSAHIIRSAVQLPTSLSGVCISQNVSNFILSTNKTAVVTLNFLI